MERVAFLIEKTGQRIACMLNPETLIARRSAGIVRRNGDRGALQGIRQTDDMLLYVGGGATEMILDLLFDTTLSDRSETAAQIPTDVRELTRPLWNLAENSSDDSGQGQLPIARFVWGKTWNVPGVIAAVAERLEFFDETGVPRRSWLRMRFCRVNSDDSKATAASPLPNVDDLVPVTGTEEAIARAAVEVTGGAADEDSSEGVPTRLDDIAYRMYGNAGFWRLLARFNDIEDPLSVPSGTLLRMPDSPGVGARAKEEA